MEKLINYLNEYQKTVANEIFNENVSRELNRSSIYHIDLIDKWEWDNYCWYIADCQIISKKFWFIKWLVENDKIETLDDNSNYSKDEEIIRELSISDNPIQDLISLLK